jgi:hypothetical protein
VRVLVDGLRDFNDQSKYIIQPLGLNSAITSVIEEFAGLFTFDLELTPQMVAAFPLFFRHCYENLRSDRQPEPLDFALKVDKGQGSPEPFHYEHPAGLTPLEFYAHFLLDDPALSDQLCRSILWALRMLETSANEVRKTKDKSFYEYQRDVIQADLPIFDFVRSHPPRGLPKLNEGELRETKKALGNTIPLTMELVGVYFPYIPRRQRKVYRAFLNGAIPVFAVWWLEVALFVLSYDESPARLSFVNDPRFIKCPGVLQDPICEYNDLMSDFEADAAQSGSRRIRVDQVDELGPPEDPL